MNDYTPPVSGLLTLGRPEHLRTGIDYRALGFDTPHVPELLRLLQDQELSSGAPETPEVFAQLHAWRALGQLRAPEAIEPLLDLLEEQDDDDDYWDDWTTEEVPFVLGQIGPAVIPATVARLAQRGQREHAPCYFSNALAAVAQQFPETRDEVIGHIAAVLSTASANNASLNGFIVADLVDLEADEAWPAIETAFATGNVDESIVGDAAEVKYQLGLGPKPPPSGQWVRTPSPANRGMNAKQRFNERQRKKKAEKKKNKKKRNG